MDVLPIQASSVPSERVFSSGKETMDAHRRHISPHLMEALQILKFSFRKNGKPLKFTEGLSWSDELKEFEAAARTAPLGDPDAYGRNLDVDHEDSDDMDEVLDDIIKELEADEGGLGKNSEEASSDEEDMYASS
jgi:hAT family C-terminal dimerisation region